MCGTEVGWSGQRVAVQHGRRSSALRCSLSGCSCNKRMEVCPEIQVFLVFHTVTRYCLHIPYCVRTKPSTHTDIQTFCFPSHPSPPSLANSSHRTTSPHSSQTSAPPIPHRFPTDSPPLHSICSPDVAPAFALPPVVPRPSRPLPLPIPPCFTVNSISETAPPLFPLPHSNVTRRLSLAHPPSCDLQTPPISPRRHVSPPPIRPPPRPPPRGPLL